MAKLTNNESRGFTHATTFTADDLIALGTGNQSTLIDIPPGGVITQCGLVITTAVTGTSSDITIDVGTTGADPDEAINAFDLDTVTKAAFNTGDVLINTAAGYMINNTTSDVPLLMEVNGTLTAAGLATGEIIIAFTLLDAAPLVS